MTLVDPDLSFGTDDELLASVRHLIGGAIQRQLWVLFLDRAGDLKLVAPGTGNPVRPTREECDRLAENFAEVARHLDADEVVLVHERPGPPAESAHDLAWARYLTLAHQAVGLPIRALLLCSDAGVHPLGAELSVRS